jgi:hypothetical protein
MTETTVTVVGTYDEEWEARIEADRLYRHGKRVGVAKTLDWNRAHPDSISKTTSRFLVYEERHS